MRKIMLLNPPATIKYIRDFYCSFSSKANYYWPPQDLLALSGILSKEFEVEVLDAIGSGLKEQECYEKITDSFAETIIFSTGAASFERDARFLEGIKAQKNVKIIASSSIFRHAVREAKERFPFLDAFITDFTDRGIVEYLKGNHEEFGKMIYKKENEISIGKNEKAGDFSIGLPLQGQFISKSNRLPFFGGQPFAITLTSAGCIFSCGFCVAGTMKFRKRELGEVFEELEYINRLGIKRVLFVDPLFTAEQKRVLEFCKELLNRNLGIEWACNAHAVTIQDKDLLKTMKSAGCRALLIGIESANEAILRKYNKMATREQIKTAFALCGELNIKTLAYFIIGLGGEDLESAKMTIRFSKEIKCDYASFSFATPDFGTELRDESLRNGWVADSVSWDRLDSSVGPSLSTDKLSEAQAKSLVRAAYREFYLRPGYILKKAREARSLLDIKCLFEEGNELLKKNIL